MNMSLKINPLVSTRRSEYSSYSDNDIQNQYSALDDKRKALILGYDSGEVTDDQLDAIDRELFKLDDELCARGL